MNKPDTYLGPESAGPFKAVTKYGKHWIIAEFDEKKIAQFKTLADAARFARIVNEHDERMRQEYEKKAKQGRETR